MPRVDVIDRILGLDLQSDNAEKNKGYFQTLDNAVIYREGTVESSRGYESLRPATPGARGYADSFSGLFVFDRVIFAFTEEGSTKRILRLSETPTAFEWQTIADSSDSNFPGHFDFKGSFVRAVEADGRCYILGTDGPHVIEIANFQFATRLAGMKEALTPRVTLLDDYAEAGPAAGDAQTDYRVVFMRRFTEGGREKRSAPSAVATVRNIPFTGTYTEAAGVVTIDTNTTVVDGIDLGGAPLVTIDHENGDIPVDTYPITGLPSTENITITKPSAMTETSGDTSGHWTIGAVTLEIPFPGELLANDHLEIYRSKSVDGTGASTPEANELFLIERIELTQANIDAGTYTYVDDSLTSELGEPVYTSTSVGEIDNHPPPYCEDLALFGGHMIYAAPKWPAELTVTITLNTDVVTIGSEVYTSVAVGSEDAAAREFEVGSGATGGEQLRERAVSLVYVINAGSDRFWAEYVSGEDDLPGEVRIVSKVFDTSVHTVTTDDGISETADRPGEENQIAISKNNQPESVPRTNTRAFGSDNDPIVRLATLRNALLVFKDREGLWSLSGQTDGALGADFFTAERDSSAQITAADSLAVVGNRAIFLSSQGFLSASENAVLIIGRKVEADVRKIVSNLTTKTATHAVSYEADQHYYCWTPATKTGANTLDCWAYNVVLKTWTKVYKNISCDDAAVATGDLNTRKVSKLYMLLDGTPVRERKDYASTDHQDHNGAALPFEAKTLWITGKSAALLKHFTFVEFQQEKNEATEFTFDFYTEHYQNAESSDLLTIEDDGAYFVEPVRAEVPLLMQRATRLAVGIRHSKVQERFTLARISADVREISSRTAMRKP